MPFQHDIAGGQGNLVVTSLKSPNFIHATQGWAINKDGSAEFHSIILPSGQGVSVYIQSSAPVTTHTGDLWYNTSNGLLLSQWNGSAWVPYQIGTGAIANQAVTNTQLANTVTARSLNGITTTVSGTQPTGSLAGDIWIDSAANNSIWQYNGTSWSQYQFGKLAISPGSVDNTRLNASVTARSLNGITTTISSTIPATGVLGDLWLDSANGYQLKQCTTAYSSGGVSGDWTAISWTATNVLSAATITGTLIAASTIVGGNIAAGTITATNIAAATITGSLIAASTITGGLIAAGTITASNIQSGTITATQIASATITGAQIAATTITASNIAANTITASQIAANTITAAQIAANTITASQIAANTITAGQIAAGTITGIYTGAAYFGQNMIQDPAFSSSLLNAVRTGDAVTNGTWTLSGGTAAVTAGTPAKHLVLMPSGQQNFFVTPGEQFYLSITGTVTASCQIGIEIAYDNATLTTISATNTGTFTASGVVTVPAGAKYGYIRIFAFASSGSPTATLSNPACYIASLFSPTITGGSITGAHIVADGSSGEVLVYSGAPATGNLIASVSGASGTDGHSNAYLKGVSAYQGLGGSTYAVNINTGSSGGEPGMVVHNQTNVAFNDPGFFAQASGGTPNIADATMSSGQATNTDVAALVEVISQAESGFTNGEIDMVAGEILAGASSTVIIDDNNGMVNLANTKASPTTPALGSSFWANTNGTPSWVNTTGQKGQIPATQGLQGGNTNNTTSNNAMFTPFSIPANDAKNGTAYRIRCGGHGTQATGTAVSLNFQLRAFNLNWGASTDNGGVAAGATFHWDFEGTLIIGGNTSTSPGSFFGKMTISQAAANAAGHTTAMDSQVTNTVDTTIAQNITLQAGWASITGSPTLVCTGATFERLGA